MLHTSTVAGPLGVHNASFINNGRDIKLFRQASPEM